MASSGLSSSPDISGINTLAGGVLLKHRTNRACKFKHKWLCPGAKSRSIDSPTNFKKVGFKQLTKVQFRVGIRDPNTCADAKPAQPHSHTEEPPHLLSAFNLNSQLLVHIHFMCLALSKTSHDFQLPCILAVPYTGTWRPSTDPKITFPALVTDYAATAHPAGTCSLSQMKPRVYKRVQLKCYLSSVQSWSCHVSQRSLYEHKVPKRSNRLTLMFTEQLLSIKY